MARAKNWPARGIPCRFAIRWIADRPHMDAISGFSLAYPAYHEASKQQSGGEAPFMTTDSTQPQPRHVWLMGLADGGYADCIAHLCSSFVADEQPAVCRRPFYVGAGSWPLYFGNWRLGAQVQFWLLTNLGAPLGAAIATAIVLLPLATLTVMPSPDNGRAAGPESVSRLANDMSQLVRHGPVLGIMALFVLPCGACILTNTFGGICGVFHASPRPVDGATGFLTVIVSLIAALSFKPLLTRVRAPLAYLAIGALFTLPLPLALAPWVFVLAVVGKNIAHTCAQVAQNTMVLRSIPRGSTLASSQFGLLQTAALVPYAYMPAIDGQGFAWRGVSGLFLMDAGISLVACAVVLIPVWRWLRAGLLEAPQDAMPVEMPQQVRPVLIRTA